MHGQGCPRVCGGDRSSASASELEEWLQWEVVVADRAAGPGFLEHRKTHELHKVCLMWERAGVALLTCNHAKAKPQSMPSP